MLKITIFVILATGHGSCEGVGYMEALLVEVLAMRPRQWTLLDRAETKATSKRGFTGDLRDKSRRPLLFTDERH